MGIDNGQVADADEVLNAVGSNFVDNSQVIFDSDYNGFDSRISNTGVPSLKNVFYSTFIADDADTNLGFAYDSTNDLYKTPDLGTEYVIIEADDASVSWSSNNTNLVKFDTGKWVLYGTTGTDAVKRAQIHKSLWYGTNGSNQLILDFTNITAVKTSHANDVGKQGHYATVTIAGGSDVNPANTYTGTFVDTSTNTNCSSWSNVTASVGTAQWEIASGSVKNSVSASTSNELGTDTSADELNNPANCQLQQDNASSGQTTDNDVVILCVGDITWAGGGGSNGSTTQSNIDFFTTHSIPLLTDAGTISASGVDTATLIFKDTVASTDNGIMVVNSTVDGANTLVLSLSANGGSNYTTATSGEIVRPTAGTALWRRAVITRTDITTEDEITEQSVKYSLY